MRLISLLFIILFGQNINAKNYSRDYKNATVAVDTINQFDIQKRKTGYWIEHLFKKQYEDDTSFWYIDKGYYEKGKRLGLWQGYYTGTNSLYLKVYFIEEEKDSLLVIYYPNGNIEFSHERSKTYGYVLSRDYWKNGCIKNEFYQDSILYKNCNYNRNGKLELCVEELLNTDNNLIVTRTSYFASGAIKSIDQLRRVPETSSREYEPNGMSREYTEDSHLRKVQNSQYVERNKYGLQRSVECGHLASSK